MGDIKGDQEQTGKSKYRKDATVTSIRTNASGSADTALEINSNSRDHQMFNSPSEDEWGGEEFNPQSQECMPTERDDQITKGHNAAILQRAPKLESGKASHSNAQTIPYVEKGLNTPFLFVLLLYPD